MPLQSFTYNDGNVPFGARTIELKRGSVDAPESRGTYVLESINLTYPAKVTERPDQIGKPNGWFCVQGQPHGTAVMQIPLVDQFVQIGDWFEDAFGNEDEGGNSVDEHWVIVEKSQPFAIHDYWKVNVTLRLAIDPP